MKFSGLFSRRVLIVLGGFLLLPVFAVTYFVLFFFESKMSPAPEVAYGFTFGLLVAVIGFIALLFKRNMFAAGAYLFSALLAVPVVGTSIAGMIGDPIVESEIKDINVRVNDGLLRSALITLSCDDGSKAVMHVKADRTPIKTDRMFYEPDILIVPADRTQSITALFDPGLTKDPAPILKYIKTQCSNEKFPSLQALLNYTEHFYQTELKDNPLTREEAAKRGYKVGNYGE